MQSFIFLFLEKSLKQKAIFINDMDYFTIWDNVML